MKVLILVLLMISGNVMAHGDHSAPGAIPPSPNGGVLSEAKHNHGGSHDHNHKKAEEREIFFEAKLNKNLLTIFPLELAHKKGTAFKELQTSFFSDLKILVKDPRKKKTIPSKIENKKGMWKLQLEKSRARRMLVEISTKFNGAQYTSKIQVEKK